jgi:DNA-binding response OmpR family regulator
MDTLEAIYIEDDEQEAFIMRVGMRRQGIKVTHVPDISVDTIHDLQAPPYQNAVAVIFDAILTGTSGVTLARALRTSGDNRLIVLLTAGENPDPDLLKRYNIYYLRKPPKFEQLAAMIRDAVGQ